MKTTSLALFAALVLLGWTSLAAGAIAALSGDPVFSNRAHTHQQVTPPAPPETADPLIAAPLSLTPAGEPQLEFPTSGLL